MLNKNFTQHVTIRGEDLEKMPFTNLTDAIRPWLFGAYTQPGSIVYVVDGNPVADVNVYPIYDIEEVTFINNAVATAGYGESQGELVLITTRRGKGKGGVRVAAQAGLVRATVNGTDSYLRVYHQYYIGAYRNLDKVSFGVSAGWQRDADPEFKYSWPTPNVSTPLNLQRWRLNGYLDWRPNAENTVEVRLNYTPQLIRQVLDSSGAQNSYYASEHYSVHSLTPSVTWDGHWGAGLHNKFFAAYLHAVPNVLDNETDSGGYYGYRYQGVTASGKEDHVFLRDHLSYEVRAGKWRIAPAVDISWQHIDEESKYFVSDQNYGGIVPPGSYASLSDVEEKGSLFYLVPAVDLSWQRAFDLQAGVFVNASSKTDTGSKRLFPFVTAAVDLLHLSDASKGSSLKIFGSYARRPLMYVNDYTLPDFTGAGASQSLYNIFHNSGGYFTANGTTLTSLGIRQIEPGYWTWNTGAAYSTADGRVTLQYSYERRNISDYVVNNYNSLSYVTWKESFDHVDMRFKVIEAKSMSWFTGLNFNLMRVKCDTLLYQYGNGSSDAPLGDSYPSKLSWTGGWVNRLSLGRFIAGLDVMYHLRYESNGNGIPRNALAVSNVYAGYRLALPHERVLELFLESRAPIINNLTDLQDRRRYYTLGAGIAF